jgi:GNAT superfamily N-acetyltransferase
MVVREITERELVGRFLKHGLVENAYQLGYLDEAYAEFCHWYGCEDPGLQTLVLIYTGLSRPGIFTAGNPAGIKPILKEFDQAFPERATGHIARAHMDAIRTHYRDDNMRLMLRMGLRRDQFVDPGHDATASVEVLTHRDTGAIMRLYGAWPDNFFEPYQLETGLYFGVRGEDGELACIAGIHNVSRQFDVAAIGNLVTHPSQRGKGYARVVTAALLRETFKRVGNVTLDVEDENTPAMRLYQHFGFRHSADFWEGELSLRK